MNNHFDTLADVYNKLWFLSEDYQSTMLHAIIAGLELNADDSLVDLGGGTGVYTALLQSAAGLRKAYCVEPSLNMYLEALKIPSIQAIHADDRGFMALDLAFTKVLVKEAVHHIAGREALWTCLRGRLPEAGRILIVTRPQDTQLPLFQKAKQNFSRNQPHHETLIKELENCGFKTGIKQHPYRFTLDKPVWYAMIRKRFMSDLAIFSDEEIETGLLELDERYPQDVIEIPDTVLYISAC